MRKLTMAVGILFLTASLCGAEETSTTTQAQAPAATTQAQQAAPKPEVQQESPFKTLKERVSYAIGMAMARNMKAQGIDLDADIFAKAFKDTVSGTEPAMTDQEAQAAMTAFQAEMVAKKQEEMKKLGEENKKKGEAFLAENKKKEGVKVTASGLQYKVIKEGDGKKPGAKDTVKVNYKGTLLDGTEFDSSYKRNEPATFPVSGVIPGWTEALQLMKTGSKYEVVIPSNLAYGEAGAGGVIPPNATLVFEVELLSIVPPEAKTKEAPKKDNQGASKKPAQTGKTTKSSK
jgi:FKBP-type peptidyl-prolyl cis-trans isomerase